MNSDLIMFICFTTTVIMLFIVIVAAHVVDVTRPYRPTKTVDVPTTPSPIQWTHTTTDREIMELAKWAQDSLDKNDLISVKRYLTMIEDVCKYTTTTNGNQ